MSCNLKEVLFFEVQNLVIISHIYLQKLQYTKISKSILYHQNITSFKVFKIVFQNFQK